MKADFFDALDYWLTSVWVAVAVIVLVLFLTSCSEKKAVPPPIEEQKTFSFQVENVKVEGAVKDASQLKTEKAKAETAVKLAK
jgi:hypothetical protein